MSDIIFKTEAHIFSYRVAGVCIHDGKILLQKPTDDTAYAIPGGHVSFGETHNQTLIREFQEEIGVPIAVGDLLWIGELFFPWGEKQCHQICLYYAVELWDDTLPRSGSFMGWEHLENRSFDLEYHWIPIEQLNDIEIYPTRTFEMIQSPGVHHFVYHENGEDKKEIILS